MSRSTLTETEKKALKCLRAEYPHVVDQLNDYMKKDESILRFLKARDLDVTKGGEMLQKYVEWRQENDVDNVRTMRLPEIFENTLSFYPCGYDKDGYPVGVIPIGRWNLRRCIEGGHGKEFRTYATQLFEQVSDFCRFKSTEDMVYTQVNVIIDYDGFSPFNLASREVVEALLDTLRVFEANYPETLKACWVVNASTVFQLVYNLVSPLMSKHTMSKVRIFGCSPNEWKTDLLQEIDPDQLPSAYGGAITTVFPYKIKYGFDVFPVYDLLPEEDFTSVWVPAGQKYEFEVTDATVGEKITWNFKTVDYNIEFSVIERDSHGKEEPILEPCKVDSHNHLQLGAIMAKRRGTYILVFNNAYSKLRAKQLHYAVQRGTSM